MTSIERPLLTRPMFSIFGWGQSHFFAAFKGHLGKMIRRTETIVQLPRHHIFSPNARHLVAMSGKSAHRDQSRLILIHLLQVKLWAEKPRRPSQPEDSTVKSQPSRKPPYTVYPELFLISRSRVLLDSVSDKCVPGRLRLQFTTSYFRMRCLALVRSTYFWLGRGRYNKGRIHGILTSYTHAPSIFGIRNINRAIYNCSIYGFMFRVAIGAKSWLWPCISMPSDSVGNATRVTISTFLLIAENMYSDFPTVNACCAFFL